jgi:hypothetical protein
MPLSGPQRLWHLGKLVSLASARYGPWIMGQPRRGYAREREVGSEHVSELRFPDMADDQGF